MKAVWTDNWRMPEKKWKEKGFRSYFLIFLKYWESNRLLFFWQNSCCPKSLQIVNMEPIKFSKAHFWNWILKLFLLKICHAKENVCLFLETCPFLWCNEKSERNLGQVYWCTGQQRLHTPTSKDSIFVTMCFYKLLKPISVSVIWTDYRGLRLGWTLLVQQRSRTSKNLRTQKLLPRIFKIFQKKISRNVAYFNLPNKRAYTTV